MYNDKVTSAVDIFSPESGVCQREVSVEYSRRHQTAVVANNLLPCISLIPQRRLIQENITSYMAPIYLKKGQFCQLISTFCFAVLL